MSHLRKNRVVFLRRETLRLEYAAYARFAYPVPADAELEQDRLDVAA
jgi:hypothetical protein